METLLINKKWFQIVKYDNGKPDMNAIIILSEFITEGINGEFEISYKE